MSASFLRLASRSTAARAAGSSARLTLSPGALAVVARSKSSRTALVGERSFTSVSRSFAARRDDVLSNVSEPTGSQESVQAEHSPVDPLKDSEGLPSKMGSDIAGVTNDVTMAEQNVKAELSPEDPLPDSKKANSSEPPSSSSGVLDATSEPTAAEENVKAELDPTDPLAGKKVHKGTVSDEPTDTSGAATGSEEFVKADAAGEDPLAGRAVRKGTVSDEPVDNSGAATGSEAFVKADSSIEDPLAGRAVKSSTTSSEPIDNIEAPTSSEEDVKADMSATDPLAQTKVHKGTSSSEPTDTSAPSTMAEDDVKADMSSEDPLKQSRGNTVFLGGISSAADEIWLREAIEDTLELSPNSSDITRLSLVPAQGGKSFGYAFAHFSKPELAERLIEAEMVVDGRVVRASYAKNRYEKPQVRARSTPQPSSPRNAPSKTVYIANLPFAAEEDDLEELLRPYGNIEGMSLVTRNDGTRTGTAFIKYEDLSAAEAVVDDACEHGFSVRGRPIVVDYSLREREQPGRRSPERRPPRPMTPSETDPDAPRKTVFLRDIALNADETIVREGIEEALALGASASEIKSVRLIRDRRGEPRGTGFVEFTTPEVAEKMLNATVDVFGRTLAAEFAKNEPHGPSRRALEMQLPRTPQNSPSQKVYIGNVPWTATGEDLNDILSGYGNILDIKVHGDEHRGIAFATFADLDAAEAFVNAGCQTGVRLSNRLLRVDYAIPRQEDR